MPSLPPPTRASSFAPRAGKVLNQVVRASPCVNPFQRATPPRRAPPGAGSRGHRLASPASARTSRLRPTPSRFGHHHITEIRFPASARRAAAEGRCHAPTASTA